MNFTREIYFKTFNGDFLSTSKSNWNILSVEDKIMHHLNKLDTSKMIVYDIDDTLISSSKRPKNDIIRTYYHARLRGFPLAIITARQGSENAVKFTINELDSYGIDGYKYIYFRPPELDDQFHYKKKAREDLHNKGYEVAMTIGDQPQDIGEYGGIGIIV